MPICVAGMHRSGTSLVARLLAASGVYGGSPAELVAPAPDNPEGFGESLPFLRLNDAVLARLGGFWDSPPAMPPGWAVSPRLSNLRRDAATLVGRFRGQEPWFWKDPRNRSPWRSGVRSSPTSGSSCAFAVRRRWSPP